MNRVITHGEIIAYRYWRVVLGNMRINSWRSAYEDPCYDDDKLRLSSLYAPNVWSPGETLVSDVDVKLIKTDRRAGIHSWRTTGDMLNRDRWQAARYSCMISCTYYVVVAGKVSLWGDVIEHRNGYRASHAAVHSLYSGALWCMPEDVEWYGRIVQELSRSYDVPVEDGSTILGNEVHPTRRAHIRRTWERNYTARGKYLRRDGDVVRVGVAPPFDNNMYKQGPETIEYLTFKMEFTPGYRYQISCETVIVEAGAREVLLNSFSTTIKKGCDSSWGYKTDEDV